MSQKQNVANKEYQRGSRRIREGIQGERIRLKSFVLVVSDNDMKCKGKEKPELRFNYGEAFLDPFF